MSEPPRISGIRQALLGLMALMAILSILAGVFILLRSAILMVLRLNTSVASVIVAGLLTLLTSVLVNAWNRNAQGRLEERTRLREAKRPIYEHLLTVVFDVFRRIKSGVADDSQAYEAKTVDEMTHIVEKLIIWGSDDMIRIWGTWLSNANRLHAEGNQGSVEALLTLSQMMMAIRKELGYTKTNISDKDLLRLFITDIDELNKS